jgi:hypothetical protein
MGLGEDLESSSLMSVMFFSPCENHISNSIDQVMQCLIRSRPPKHKSLIFRHIFIFI